MRRMYGDMESTSVYREMRSTSSSESGEDQAHSRSMTDESTGQSAQVAGAGLMPDLFSSLEYNIRMGSGFATVQSAKEPVSFISFLTTATLTICCGKMSL
jgi:hypothetical protein